ncbi:hypothetical protein GCM10020000_48440 [Streptomyces olivoverticillatus]
MAVTGIREMSTITTPPEERHPVLTFVGPYDQKQIGAAIRRELLREGQVFYIHNRVESIDRAAAKLREFVPEARIATAHGQMGESALEQVVVDFWEKKFDVLVSTTIVESGIDISNANTLIVERGDNFGLSQLHQLRGRVGRSRERGYAYFLYPPEKPLTETAHERLATIAQHTEMGAGMYVAMKDLEIRGAGNLLGGEQSGHIAGVGFDLYIRMVGEAVADYRASLEGGEEAPEAPLEVKIELPVDAHVPHDYAPRRAAAPAGLPRHRLRHHGGGHQGRPRGAHRPLRQAARARGEPAAGRGPADAGPRLRGRRHHAAGAQRAIRPGGAAGVAGAAAQAAVPAYGPQARRRSRCWYRGLTTRPIGGKPLVGRELLAWTGEFLTTILGGREVTPYPR